MTRVKICGITREADLEAAVAAGADAVGVTAGVAVDTPREVPPEAAADLVESVPPFVTSVLVTMPGTVSAARGLAAAVEPDVLQVHGDLDPAAVADLRESVPARVVPALGVGEPRIEDYAEVADALVVDSVDADGAGGTGETHDWARTRDLVESLPVPVVLAGGLTSENVAEAVRTVGPYAVDVASGVEREGGVKDHDAVAAFVRRAKSAPVRA